MKKITSILLVISAFGMTATAAEGKLRLPASVNCDEVQMTQDLIEFISLMSVQKTLKPSRYAKMMEAMQSAKSCDEVNKIALVAIGDCVLTDRKKTACK